MKSIALVIALSFSSFIYSQLNIIPQPAEVKVENGTFTLKQPVGFIFFGDVGQQGVNFFKDYLKKYYNVTDFREGTEHSYGFPSEIFIADASDYPPTSPKDGYELRIDKSGIHIVGNDVGIFYAFQTLIQLLPPHVSNNLIQLPYVTIKDYPRFGYRGLHLDCGRHFMSVDFIKKYIDYIAYHKMNYFHWHLTDDQGWRIEIKKYPNLTKIGAWRNGTIIGRYPGTGNDNTFYGGFYTQNEIKDVVKYAADRHITVIPEIEMPGHSSAAIAAYPWLSCFPDEPTMIPSHPSFASQLAHRMPTNPKDTAGKRIKLVQETWGVFEDVFCAGKDSTFTFLQNVMDEVLPLFPSKIIHIGGDECPKANWKRCPKCQARMKELGLKNEEELQSYFIQRMEKYLNSKGRTMIGWDEILEGGLAPNATVMSWRGMSGGIAAAKMGHQVVMTPWDYCYLDLYQAEPTGEPPTYGLCRLSDSYNYEPVPDSVDEKLILGGQGNLWTESVPTFRHAEYMTWPRGMALSEVYWSARSNKNWDDFISRLEKQFPRLDAANVKYSTSMYNVIFQPARIKNSDFGVTLTTEVKGLDIYYTFDNTNPDNFSPKFTGTPIQFPVGATNLNVITYRNGKPIGEQINITKDVLSQRLDEKHHVY